MEKQVTDCKNVFGIYLLDKGLGSKVYLYCIYVIYISLCLCPHLQFNNMTNSIIENEQKTSTVY